MTILTHPTLVTLAARAFRLGLSHGGHNNMGMDSAEVAGEIRLPITRLPVHRQALHRVYEAGLEIARGQRAFTAQRKTKPKGTRK